MTMALFPCLPGTTLDAVNTVGAWLAQDDYQDNQPVDLVILAGNAVIPAIDAACKIAAEQGGSSDHQRRDRSLDDLPLRRDCKAPPL